MSMFCWCPEGACTCEQVPDEGRTVGKPPELAAPFNAAHAVAGGDIYKAFANAETKPMVADREEFEALYTEWRGTPEGWVLSQRMGDSYRLPKLSAAWHWFQAAQRSLLERIVDLEATEAALQAELAVLRIKPTISGRTSSSGGSGEVA